MFVIRGNEVYMGVVLSNYLLMKTQKNFSLLQIYFCKILIIINSFRHFSNIFISF